MSTINSPDSASFIRSSNLSSHSYRCLLRSVASGKDLHRIKNGLYATSDALAADIIDIDKIIPGGTLCLYSAWHFYGLTTQVPGSFYIAIHRNRKITLPSMPEITLVFQSASILDLGATEIVIDGINLKIFDRERCTCDAIKYRNKIGLDVMSEILKSYLSRPDRNLDTLCQYAAKLRVLNTLKNYLTIAL